MKSETKRLQDEWDALMQKHSKPLELGAVAKGVKTWKLRPTKTVRASPAEVLKSLVTPGGSTALKAPKVYTGDNLIGISQMSKSNAVPVFNTDHIVEIARMRR
jgi:hypothetical protein